MLKKILIITGGSYVAGMEIVTLHLIKGLKENGLEVHCIINGWNDGDFKTRLTNMDVHFNEVKLGWLYIRKPFWTIDSLIHYPEAYLKCKKIIKDFKPDIVHFSSFPMPVMLYPLIKSNSVFTLHDTHLPNLKHRLIYRLLNTKICFFIAVSQHIAVTLENLAIPARKIKIINNGILPPKYLPEPKEKNFKVDNINFAIIGQVAEHKGHTVLINAVEMLIKKGIKNFKVLIIGNNKNEYAKKMIALLEEKKLASFFIWQGFITNTEEIYNKNDVVIIPSLCEEAFSLTTAEAMIRGLATIASNRGGIVELISDGENGLLFKCGDALELSECMNRLINNRIYIIQLGENARKKAMANFGYKLMTDKYIEIYQQIFNLSSKGK